jgi:methylenetetrahydrofolate dehydrogenase (NADP+)/methenyltetrahydrofolate cyclohydrolase
LVPLEYMRILDGRELADYVKERQAKQVRNLRQSWKTFPKLVILITQKDAVVDTFVRLKQTYGEDILIDVEVKRVSQAEAIETIDSLNADPLVHGIIVQLPIADPLQTDEVVNAIAPAKDVDGLGMSGTYISATATAIDWLVAGYNVTLRDKLIAIVGQGRLVGAPLAKLWATAGLNVVTYDDTVADLSSELKKADVIITATGVPSLITSQMISPGRVVVDAGTASENGTIVGDVADDVRERQDLSITPVKGGVGPLTIAALFDNVIVAAQATVQKD